MKRMNKTVEFYIKILSRFREIGNKPTGLLFDSPCKLMHIYWILTLLYTVSQKRPTILFVHNFAKCWPILKLFSFLDSEGMYNKFIVIFPPHLKM